MADTIILLSETDGALDKTFLNTPHEVLAPRTRVKTDLSSKSLVKLFSVASVSGIEVTLGVQGSVDGSNWKSMAGLQLGGGDVYYKESDWLAIPDDLQREIQLAVIAAQVGNSQLILYKVGVLVK